MICKPELKKVHINARNEWARNHLSWSHQWKKVMFSDENKFNLDGSDNIKCY